MVKKLQSFAMCNCDVRLSLIDEETGTIVFYYEPTSDVVSAYAQLFNPPFGRGLEPMFLNCFLMEFDFSLWTKANESEDEPDSGLQIISVNGIPLEFCKIYEQVGYELINFTAQQSYSEHVSSTQVNFYFSITCPESSVSWLRPGKLESSSVLCLARYIEVVFQIMVSGCPRVDTDALKTQTSVTLGSKFEFDPRMFGRWRPSCHLQLYEAFDENSPSCSHARPPKRAWAKLAPALSLEELAAYRGCSPSLIPVPPDSDVIPLVDLTIWDRPAQSEMIMDSTMFGSVKLLGQLYNSFIICETETIPALFLAIDEHAVAERIQYEELLRKICGVRLEQVISDEPSDQCVLRVSALPKCFLEFGSADVNYIACLTTSLLDEIVEKSAAEPLNEKDLVPELVYWTLGSISCREATEFGTPLTYEGAAMLIRMLSCCSQPFLCVHQLPTLFPVSGLEALLKPSK
ncbi:unnamed protein product [Soboliphyme baturini]|uniref:DNA helicase n=1 Tax=Soboliphyme baturini TaxID=241478 RepID=A0A183J176_9BILA|nr:unnamed protein product [Soboliphyme baturini]